MTVYKQIDSNLIEEYYKDIQNKQATTKMNRNFQVVSILIRFNSNKFQENNSNPSCKLL